MSNRTLRCVALFGWLIAASASLQAHHSLAVVYDMEAEKEMSGTITTVKFTNPHGSLALAVKNADGSTSEWMMVLGTATALAQRGIGKTGENALHAGDNTRVNFHPAKDGSLSGYLKTVTMPDGRVIQISADHPVL